MRSLDIKENWDEIAERLRGRFSKLTESDVTFIDGRHYEMVDKIRTRLGRTQAEIETLLESMNSPVG
jgi:hypothetical protein